MVIWGSEDLFLILNKFLMNIEKHVKYSCRLYLKTEKMTKNKKTTIIAR